MKSKKIMATLLAGAMVLSMAACGDDAATEVSESGSEVVESSVPESVSEEQPATGNTAVEEGPKSIDFSDGLYGFIGVDKVINSACDDSLIELSEYNGSAAVKITPQGKNPYIGIQMDALVGDAVGNVASVDMTLAIESPDGNFYSASGNIYGLLGENNDKYSAGWSIYLENANPKTCSYTLDTTAVAGNYLVLSMESDTGASDAGVGQASLYILDITFKDASGNVIEADSSAEFVKADSGADRVNLFGIKGAVEFPGFTVSAGSWTQDGFEMPQEIIDALVPGSVVEITYTSTTGNIWLVMPGAAAGWMRVGVGDNDGSGQEYTYYNSSRTTAQITYEQLAEICGDDASTWGTMMQCESDGDWEVFSVKVGQQAPNYVGVSNAVEFEGFVTSAGGWSQEGFEMPQEIIDALVPGSVVEITYASETGEIWLVMPDAAAGWMRVGVGNYDGSGSDYAVCDGSKAYITYEQLAAVLGDDVSTWGTRMQCEASSAWEVFGVRVGTAEEFLPLKQLKELEGFNVSGSSWGQNGIDMTEDFIAALVPGSVIEITYSSESGDMWIVLPGAAAGWMRVGVGDLDGSGQGYAVYDGKTCQIPFEMIAEFCGDDVSAWGTTLQCEATTNWEVYSVAVGQAQ